MVRILLIHNDRDSASSVKQVLKSVGCLTDIAYTPVSGKTLAVENKYQVILIYCDFQAGLSQRILINIRAAGIRTPILMIGSHLTVGEMTEYFKRGANDFLTVPCSSELLSLRLKILTKNNNKSNTYYRVGDVEFHADLHLLRGVNQEVLLTKRESELLELLVINRKQVIGKPMIEERLWRNTDDFNDNIIEVHMSHLRKKLKKTTDTLNIETIRNVGYSLNVSKDPIYC